MSPPIRQVDPAEPGAQRALRAYAQELAERFPGGFDVEGALAAALTAYRAPEGVLLLVGPDDAPMACGAVTWLDADRGEIKRMWVAPSARGQGVASALLEALEAVVRDGGRGTVVLDTNGALTEAVAMYRARGYVDVPRYNDNPDATHWFAKALSGTAELTRRANAAIEGAGQPVDELLLAESARRMVEGTE